MSNSFIPQAYQAPSEGQETVVAPVKSESPDKQSKDSVGQILIKAAQYITIGTAFLTPLLFFPGSAATLGFGKALFALSFGLLAVMLLCLAALRFKQVKTVLPLPLILFWLLVIAAFLSAFLSGDTLDALRGSYLETQTAAFIAIMALVMTMTLVLQQSKKMVLYTLIAFAGGAGLLFLYSGIRFLFGPILDFGSFGTLTSSPIGSLNDLAVYAGVTVVISLITLLQLPLKRWMSIVIFGLILLATWVLMVANFFNLWIVVGFFALLFLMYTISRDALFSDDKTEHAPVSPLVIVAALFVCIVSVLFVVAGDYAGGRVSALTDVNYIEVRPSLGATTEVMRSVYQEDILLGTGPNRFGDAWRVYKDRSINETAFWNVDFNAGFGLIPTLFITLGLLGGVLLFAFHIAFLYLGYRTLLKNDNQDSFWYYVGTVSFVSALILWGISYVYVPGAAVLLITAFFTGLSFVSYGALVTRGSKVIPLTNNRRRGLLLMGIAVAIIVMAVTILFSVAQQYTAQTSFANGLQTASSVDEFESVALSAYGLYPDDRFLNTLNQLRIVELQQLLVQPEPNDADRARFESLVRQTINLASESIARDNSSPIGFVALAEVYAVLTQAGVPDALSSTLTSLDQAEARDPMNPGYSLSRAFLSARNQDFDTARSHIESAVTLKNNYTPAFFLLAQIAVQEGNVEQAIAATEQVIRFEPNNPVRFYQLGMLLAANNQLDEAILAYQAALARDNEYANARYMLALALASQGNAEAALNELRVVQASNQDNQALNALISELESTGTIQSLDLGLETPVEEGAAVESTEDGVVAEEAPATDLIVPVNTEPSQPAASENTSSEVTPAVPVTENQNTENSAG